MTAIVIPTTADPFSQQTTTLEGVTYLLTFAYNARCDCWYLSLADSQGVDIYNGVKLICNVALMRKCSDPRKPPGELFVINANNDDSPPGLNDLLASTGRCVLFYVTSDWVALWKTGAVGLNTILAQIANNTVNQTESTYGQK